MTQPTTNIKALKEASWSSTSGLNPTRITPPCYNLDASRTVPNILFRPNSIFVFSGIILLKVDRIQIVTHLHSSNTMGVL